jgi:photosystem II stability/assembly factor-like uncharacterized protein
LEVLAVTKFEDRLRTHLARVTATPPTAGFESRVLPGTVAHHAPLPKSSWAAQAVTVGALVAVGVAVLIGLRAFHEGAAVKSKTTPKPPAATSAIPGTSFYVVQMFNSKAGWALTDQGLFRTSDDWTHWIKASPAGVALGGRDTTDFLSETTAWVATIQVNNPQVITVLRTRNAGLTWQQSSIIDPNSAGPAQLDFVDALHGWLLVGYGAAASNEGVGLYRTSDGGQHWTQIEQTLGLGHDAPGSIQFACGKAGLSFVSLTTGWVSGSCQAGGAFLTVTHDGGLTWQSQVLPGTEGILYQSPTISPPVFFSSSAGYLVFFQGTFGQSVLYTTTDGGQSWAPHPLPLPPGGITPTVYFQSLDNGWIISGDGRLLYQTTDGGLHWTTYFPTPVLKEVGSIGFIDSQRGLAEAISSNNQSVLLQTTDGGRTWQQIAP